MLLSGLYYMNQGLIRSISKIVLWASLVTQLGKESTCNAGDPSSICGLGRSPGEVICYPLQYSWACQFRRHGFDP